jgi:formylmethanofuran dehydrogenase subunit E
MRKPYKFGQLSNDVRCAKCGRPIKLNVISRKEEAPSLCFKCFKKINK